jgi:hypothetical protein
LNTLVFTLISSLLLGAWLWTLRTHGSPPLRERIVYAGLASAGQIVATQTLLGALGLLQATTLAVLNALISAALLGWTLQRRNRSSQPARDDSDVATAEPRFSLTWYNVSLLVLLAFVSIWLVAAAWLLPTRGIDDLSYHLPALYQFVQDRGFSLLPLELRSTFTYPFNGDLLFLWLLVFLHADTFVDLVQFPLALLGAATLFALGRTFGVVRPQALFVALLFLFIPVVLGQAGSNYVDLIIAVWHLGLVYAAVRYYQTGAALHLAMAACASGLLLGAKYSAVAFVLAAQPIILLRLWRDHGFGGLIRRYLGLWALALPLCLYWYLRNLAATGHPFYPYRIGLAGLRPLAGTDIETSFAEAGVELGSALSTFVGDPYRFLLYLLDDPGLGSFHGGFGAVFWGLAIPAMAAGMYQAVRCACRGDWLPALFWGQPLATFLFFMAQMDNASFHLNQRYILVIPAFGLLALGGVLQRLATARPAAGRIVMAACIGGSALSIVQMAGYQLPSYQISEPVQDRLSGQRSSSYRYLKQSGFDLAVMSPAWELLDELSQAAGGWQVYMATGWKVFWTAPTFGSRLQNRIVNFQHDRPAAPDAYLFHRFGAKGYYFIGPAVTPGQVAQSGRYQLLTQLPRTAVWARDEVLRQPAVRERLRIIYERNFAADIAAIQAMSAHLPEDTPLITASRWGPALKYLSLRDGSRLDVHLVPPGGELTEARRTGSAVIFTLHAPLAGYDARLVTQWNGPTGLISVFENRLTP